MHFCKFTAGPGEFHGKFVSSPFIFMRGFFWLVRLLQKLMWLNIFYNAALHIYEGLFIKPGLSIDQDNERFEQAVKNKEGRL